MDKLTLKNKLIHVINSSDEDFLLMVNALHQNYTENISENDVVAHTIDGTTVTRKQYRQSNEAAVASYQSGIFKTQEEIHKKFATK